MKSFLIKVFGITLGFYVGVFYVNPLILNCIL